MLENKNIYAESKLIINKNECYFYHTMDIPGYGVTEGEWDLRGRENKYLGGFNFKGKRVLEVGVASGGLCFYMEKQGAEVIAYDLSDKQEWDVVPFEKTNKEIFLSKYRNDINRINNSFWLAHRVYKSKAKMVYGSIYSIPPEIGMVDVVIFGSILLHLRDPFLALQNASRLARETVIITDALSIRKFGFLANFLGKFTKPCLQFLPDYSKNSPQDAWWNLNLEVIKKFIGVLGFEKTKTTYHFQKQKNNRKRLLFTVVGQKRSAKQVTISGIK